MDLTETNTLNNNRHPWEIARFSFVNKLIPKHQNKIKILDIGSGDAYLADSFTKNISNRQLYCVDTGYTSALINKFENNYNNKNLKLHASLADVEVNKIDVVTLLDVIEHVPADVDFVNNIISQTYINDDTLFIITVPAYQSLFSRHDVALKHFRRYNLEKLKKTIKDSNLKFIDGGYFFSTLIIPRLVQLLKERTFPSKNEDLANLGTWKGGKLTTSIIKNILLLDIKMGSMFKRMGINLPGLSCYAVCMKE